MRAKLTPPSLNSCHADLPPGVFPSTGGRTDTEMGKIVLPLTTQLLAASKDTFVAPKVLDAISATKARADSILIVNILMVIPRRDNHPSRRRQWLLTQHHASSRTP